MDFLTIFIQMRHNYTSHSSRMKMLCEHNPSHSLRTVLLTLGWMRTIMVKLNSDKAEVMLFTSKHNAIHMENFTVCFGDINITPVNTARNLGVIFDSALNMKQQLNSICRAGYHQLRHVGHIRRYLTSDASKSLINGLLTSRLDYCNALLNGLRQTSINKLQRIQNTAARIVTRTSRRCHMTPILNYLHWLPFKNRVQFKIPMPTYKALHDQAPRYIPDMLTVYQRRRTLRSMGSVTLVVPMVRTSSYGDFTYKLDDSHQRNLIDFSIV